MNQNNKPVINNALESLLVEPNNKIDKALKLFFTCHPDYRNVVCHCTGFKGAISVPAIREHFDTLELLDQLDHTIEEMECDIELNGTATKLTYTYAISGCLIDTESFENRLKIAKSSDGLLPFFGEYGQPTKDAEIAYEKFEERVNTIDLNNVTHLITDIDCLEGKVVIKYIPVPNEVWDTNNIEGLKFGHRGFCRTGDDCKFDYNTLRLVTFDLISKDTSNG